MTTDLDMMQGENAHQIKFLMFNKSIPNRTQTNKQIDFKLYTNKQFGEPKTNQTDFKQPKHNK